MYRFLILSLFLFSNLECYSQMLPSMVGAVTKKKSTNTQSDAFDASSKGQYIVITNNNVTVSSSYPTPNHTWNTVYGNEGITSGIKEWEITINSFYNSGGNSWELIMGVAYERTQGNFVFNSGCRGFGYIAENGKKNTTTGSCGSQSNYGDTYGAGDVIKIQLNMNNGQLTFFKNGTSQGVSHTVDTEKTWYLGIGIGNAGTSVSITG